MLRDPRRRYWAIILLAFVLRAVVVFLPFDFSASDSYTYDFPARSLAAFHGYQDESGRPTAERPPGYPLFLALVYMVSARPVAVGLAQALLGTATVALLHRLIRRRRPEAANLAAFVLAVDPVAILLVGFLLVAWLLARKRPVPLLIAAAIVALGVGAWTYRNYRIDSKQLVLTSYPVPAGEFWLMTESTNEWLHDDSTTAFQEFHFQEIHRLQEKTPGDIAPVKSELYARALANLKREPLVVLGRAARINAWYWLEVPGSVRITIHPRLRWLRLGLIPFHWVRLLWAIAGLIELRRRRELGSFASEIAAWAFLAIGPCLLLPLPRYLAPLVAVLDGLAATGFVLYVRRTGELPWTESSTYAPSSSGSTLPGKR
ncbi:hypothetical protein HY251_10110 [bacterium]|nr:hypothetical protein [bacterium]